MIPPADPCRHCRFSGQCEQQGLVNMLALWSWLDEHGFECADKSEQFYQGIEGVYA